MKADTTHMVAEACPQGWPAPVGRVVRVHQHGLEYCTFANIIIADDQNARSLHAWLAGARVDAWFEYVPTDANVADEPSRDLSLADRVFRFAPGLGSEPVPEVCFPPLGSLTYLVIPLDG